MQTGTVSGALTAVGQTIALAYKVNPTKAKGSEKLVPRLQQALDGWRKVDPPTLKKLPVEADVPKFLADLGRAAGASTLVMAIGDYAIIAFYYLLRVGEYATKGSRNKTKQTVQFKLEDVVFFSFDAVGKLR